MKDKLDNDNDVDSNCSSDEEDRDGERKRGEDPIGQEMLVEEENLNQPLDADVGLRIRVSEYFEQDGTKIDQEDEIDDGLVKEINILDFGELCFTSQSTNCSCFPKKKKRKKEK